MATKSNKLASIAALGALALAADAQASSIGLQFTGDTAHASPATGTSIGNNFAGASVSQQYWNSYAGTVVISGQSSTSVTSGVLDNNDQASGLTFTFGYENGAATNGNDNYTDPGANALFSGFITGNNANSDHLYVQLNVPTAYQQSGYAVYLYANRSGTVPTEMAGINTTRSFSTFDQTQTITGTTTATTYASGLNYVEFTGLNSATLDVVLFEGGANGSTGYLSGVQIVQTPEPSSLGILALAGAGLLARRRRSGTLA